MAAQVALTQGKVALVDDSDLEFVQRWKWQYHRRPDGRGGYAVRRAVKGEPGYLSRSNRRNVFMHQALLGSQGVDHRDGDGLNNTRSNLRRASQTLNLAAARRKPGVSGFRGVTWDKSRTNGRNWLAQIRVKSHRHFLGFYADPKDAARAYNEAAKKYFGEFARLNEGV